MRKTQQQTSTSSGVMPSRTKKSKLLQRFRRTRESSSQNHARQEQTPKTTACSSIEGKRERTSRSTSVNNTAVMEGSRGEVRDGPQQQQQQSLEHTIPLESSPPSHTMLSRTSSALQRLAVLTTSYERTGDSGPSHSRSTRMNDPADQALLDTAPCSAASSSSSNDRSDSTIAIQQAPGGVAASSSSSCHAFNSYLFCGGGVSAYDLVEEETSKIRPAHSFPHLPDDPTVQESIECVFAHQLEDAVRAEALVSSSSLSRTQEKEDNAKRRTKIDNNVATDSLVSPAGLLQSKVQSRSIQNGGILSQRPNDNHHLATQKATLVAGQLVHVGTYDPSLGKLVSPKSSSAPHILSPKTSTKQRSHRESIHYSVMCQHCQDRRSAPAVPVDDWAQRPLMLRVTPHSGMRLLAVRYSSSSSENVLWKPGDEIDWSRRLKQDWGAMAEQPKACDGSSQHGLLQGTCPECLILPINNGNEAPGKSLVVDFESELFVGTILVRIRHAEGTTPEPYNDKKGYFAGMNRRYQIVMRGRFREAVPWTQCVAGMEFQRAYGKLPPKWILKGALKVLSFFAPQLQAQFEGDKPRSLTPLGSTPQMLRVQDGDDDNVQADSSMEEKQEEPTVAALTLLGEASDGTSSMHRARFRKRNFDKLYVKQSHLPLTDPNKVYTFEFLQHLINLQEFTIEVGSMFGNIHLEDALDGQPIQIMAKCMDGRKLWSFDLWHECLVKDALRHDEPMSGVLQ